MAGEETMSGRRGANPWRIAGWSIAATMLLLPLVAMRFTSEVNWTAGDFIFAALLIGMVGLTFELTVRVTPDWAYRGAAAVALAASFLTIWANGAVGMIGDEDNPYNLMFLGVILLALLGSAAARFRPRAMALAMIAAAIAQAALGILGAFADLRGGILATLFAGLWLLAALLFRQSAASA
jgi:hypothetical protein